jgi:tetratricopeptide (TPR) repeat protein
MHEVLHQYAVEQLQLAPVEAAATYRQHSHYYLTLVAEAEERLGSSQAATSAAEVRAAFEQIRSGWQWAVANVELPAMQQSMHGLLRYFVLTSQAEEGGRMFDAALRAVSAWLAAQAKLDHAAEQSTKCLLAELHALRARLFFKQARYAEGVDHAQQALLLADSVADSVADSAGAHRAATLANLYWGICLLSQGAYEAAEVKLRATLAWARSHPWPKLESDALRALGILADQQQDLPAARHFYQASLAISQSLDDPRGTSAALGNLGSICRQQGDFTAARTFLEQSRAIHRTIGDRSSEGRTLTHLGELALDLEEYADAERYLGESINVLRELGEEHYAADALVVLGRVYQQQGRMALAVACWEEALPIYEAANEVPGLTEVRGYLQIKSHPDG